MNKSEKRYFFIAEILLVIVAILITPWIVHQLTHTKTHLIKECVFCSEKVLKKQVLYEGEKVLVLSNFRPLIIGQTLIITKRHVVRFNEITSEENEELRQTINKVERAFKEVFGTDEYLLALQNGPKAGQTVSHVHYHLIPRVEQNVITKLKLWWSMLTNTEFLSRPLSDEELEKAYQPLKEALNKPD